MAQMGVAKVTTVTTQEDELIEVATAQAQAGRDAPEAPRLQTQLEL